MNKISEEVFPKREMDGFLSEKWVGLIRKYRELPDDEISGIAAEVTRGIATSKESAKNSTTAKAAAAPSKTNAKTSGGRGRGRGGRSRKQQ